MLIASIRRPILTSPEGLSQVPFCNLPVQHRRCCRRRPKRLLPVPEERANGRGSGTATAGAGQ